MNPSISFLQSEIKKVASESHAILVRIITLKWGSLENAKRAGEIKRVREPGGAPIRRAEVKRLRHPETGHERSALWVDKRELKDRARHLLLAYAFLRGRPYASQERTCKVAPSLSWIASLIGEAGGQAPTVDTLKAWITGTEAGAKAPAAA
jgi:hypothetical protein